MFLAVVSILGIAKPPRIIHLFRTDLVNLVATVAYSYT